jgi:FtsP/CotA-like multicopper oxidase with cupredoxin domain
MWMYHSHVNEVRDTYSGLQGPIVVTRRGMARPAGSPEDMDRELVALFQVTNENDSWLFHCHINDHILAGMQARYQVPELASHPLPAQAVLHDAAMAGRERMRFA